MAQSKRRLIERPAQIGKLASPIRMEIIDTIEALGGEATVVAIARQMGRPADGLYYHLRQLARAQLIEEIADEDKTAARRFRTVAGNARLGIRYKPGRNANARAVQDVAAGIVRLATRDFRRAMARSDTVVEGPLRELWAGRFQGWVTDAELAEINRLIARLGELMKTPRDGKSRKLVSFAWVLAPLVAKGTRRQG